MTIKKHTGRFGSQKIIYASATSGTFLGAFAVCLGCFEHEGIAKMLQVRRTGYGILATLFHFAVFFPLGKFTVEVEP